MDCMDCILSTVHYAVSWLNRIQSFPLCKVAFELISNAFFQIMLLVIGKKLEILFSQTLLGREVTLRVSLHGQISD